MNNLKLSRNFFMQPTVEVAKKLLGKKLVFQGHETLITETEAYVGKDDPACHAAVGKTARNAAMFLEGGHSYVYLIYGMYHCFNIVTEQEGFPAAVLIRGLEALEPTGNTPPLDGPGKLCRYLNITREHNAIDIVTNNQFDILDIGLKPAYTATTRIGIRKGLDKLWRFIVK